MQDTDAAADILLNRMVVTLALGSWKESRKRGGSQTIGINVTSVSKTGSSRHKTPFLQEHQPLITMAFSAPNPLDRPDLST